MTRIFAFPLAVAVLASLAMTACAARVRVSNLYDPTHHDWHRWDDSERRLYHQYWQAKHEPYRSYGALSQADLNDYWAWRHGRPDTEGTQSVKQ